MATQAPANSGISQWQDGIDQAINDAKWNDHDCNIQMAVAEINRHLSGTTGYRLLDWQLIKAMLWVESGAGSTEWKTKPMQIGVLGDPGLTSLLSGKEGGDLILPPAWKTQLTVGSARTIPAHNIRAGLGYLLMRMAQFEHKSVLSAEAKVHEVVAKPGDSLDKIAKTHGSTLEVLKKLNPGANGLRPSQVLKYQKAAVQRVIVGWQVITSAQVQHRYNGDRDPKYAEKLDYVLGVLRTAKVATCTP